MTGLRSTFPQDQQYDCEPDDYYGELKGDPRRWKRDDLHDLIKETHRFSMNSVALRDGFGGSPVVAALRELDHGSSEGTVRLTYSGDEVDGKSFDLELYWPSLLGLDDDSKSDLFNISPKRVDSRYARTGVYFGECAPDTCNYGEVELYAPPEEFRGPIARSLLYMQLRYKDEGLTLSNCPPTSIEGSSDMAYIDDLLQWHVMHPPSKAEIERNHQICTLWQGNRNPFIDFPSDEYNKWWPKVPREKPCYVTRISSVGDNADDENNDGFDNIGENGIIVNDSNDEEPLAAGVSFPNPEVRADNSKIDFSNDSEMILDDPMDDEVVGVTSGAGVEPRFVLFTGLTLIWLAI